TNGNPSDLNEIGSVPLKVTGNSVTYLRDVATVSDGNSPQLNIARHNGHRGVLYIIMKNGEASTLDVVAGVKKMLPKALATLPPAFKILPIGDQSIFVSSAVMGVVREAALAAFLTGLMILVFLGSWRNTVIIAVAIPLSILS